MKYKVIKNTLVLGKLCKMGTEIEIEDKNLEYYDSVIEKVAADKPTRKKAVK